MREALVIEIIRRSKTVSRLLVAIAGPPGSGKSTLADVLCARLNAENASSVVLPMDGFHLDNTILDQLGLRHRKGAPETFDGDGFVNLVSTIKESRESVDVPVFDRARDRVVDGVSRITPDHRIILAEGNYLLLDENPWAQLLPLFDMTVFVNPGIDILTERLIRRWLDNGHTYDEAEKRALSNDIPNAQRVLDQSVAAEFQVGMTA